MRYLILLLAAPLWAQTMTDDDLFGELDLSRPGLEAVSAALHSGDRAARITFTGGKVYEVRFGKGSTEASVR